MEEQGQRPRLQQPLNIPVLLVTLTWDVIWDLLLVLVDYWPSLLGDAEQYMFKLIQLALGQLNDCFFDFLV